MSYTSVFGGNTIYPSDVSYLSIALSVDTPLEWPLESSGTEDPAARIIDVDPSASGFSVVLPDATLTGAGQTILFNNIDGTYSFFVKDYAGNTLATVTAGTQWQVYLAATTTPAGTWRVFRYGASTATVQPSALAGFGLTVTDTTLSQSLPVTTFSTTGTTVATSNRASAFVWNSAGSGTLNLLTAASAGNNFFVFVRNEGGGDLTVEPAGTETINSAVNLVLRPGDSATLITDGATWYTIGLGQEAVFAFDYTIINVTGGTVTLSGSQLNRIAYRFEGTLSSDCTIVVPATIQQYWITNATSGAFNLFVRTSAGTPTQVNQGAKGIYYCDGTDMVLASDPTTLTTPIVISDGGTGATTASAARLNLGITSFADAIVTATTGASVRTTIGAAASGANSDITSLSGLTTPITVAQGGTGATTQTSGYLLKGNGSAAVSASVIYDTGTNVGIGTTSPGALLQLNKASGAADMRLSVGGTLYGNIYASTSDVNIFGVTAIPLLFGTDNTERMRIDSSGNVGVGLTPGCKFDVYGRGRFMQDAAATTGAITLRQNVGDTVGGFIQWVNNAVSTEKGWLVVDTSSNMIFATGSTERMRITSAGSVGIGTNSPSTALQVNGTVTATTFAGAGTSLTGTASGLSIGGNAATATNATTATTATTANALNTGNNYQVNSLGVGTAGSGTAGEIRATNNVTAYYSSDARLKENVQPIADALGIVSAVGGKTFDWTDAYIADHGGEDGYFVQKSDFGVIAQDVEAVFPLAVRTREDGTKAVDYEKLVAVAFAAIAELKAEVAEVRQQAVKVVKP